MPRALETRLGFDGPDRNGAGEAAPNSHFTTPSGLRQPIIKGMRSYARKETEMAMNNNEKADASEALILERRAQTGRNCGACSLCCKLLDINEDAFQKPAGTWCKHCRPGRGGCAIYNERPPVCRGYACEWLGNLNMGDEWQPLRSKMVVSQTVADTLTIKGVPFHHIWLSIEVDPGSPNNWRLEPYWSHIHAWSLAGLRGDASSVTWTKVTVGRRWWIILPNDEVEMTGHSGKMLKIMETGPDRWTVIKLNDAAQIQYLHDSMRKLLDEFEQLSPSMQQQLRAEINQYIKQCPPPSALDLTPFASRSSKRG
jgi:hypothetical protein